MDEITNAMKDYIKAIFLMAESGDQARTTELAKKLQVRPASVTEMIRRLASVGLIAYEPYHGMKLTDEGKGMALNILRRHRLLEKLFADFVGLDAALSCAEASKVELLLSDRTVNSICVAFNHPANCPCGKPIYCDEKCCGG